MRISAQVENREGRHKILLRTNQQVHSIEIPPKVSGSGSSTNGGELLFLALATCYCNDIYREAGRRGIHVISVEVTVDGEFGNEGQPANNVRYGARVTAEASEESIRELMIFTDSVAEIQNTLRLGMPVQLVKAEAVRVG